MGSSNDTTGALLAIRPQSPQVEFIQFLTDVIPTYNGLEQRRRLRRYPRHSLSNQYLEQDTERANQLKNQFTQDPSQAIAQPLWFESTYLQVPPTTGTNSLSVATAYANYQVGGYAMIWESAENYEVLLIAEVNTDSLVFSSNILNTYTQLPYVLPLFYMLPAAPISWIEHLNHTLFDYEATTTTPLDVEEWEYEETYGDVGVFPYDCNLFESSNTPISVENNTYGMDNGTGIFTSDSTFEISHRQFIVGINPRTREDCWKLRRVAEGLRGRQKAIWVPSYNEDLIAVEDLDGTTLVKVADNGFADIFRDYATFEESAMYNHIAISYADGSIEYKEINSLTVSSSVIELTLTSEATASPKEAVKIMLLYYARLSSDVIELEWIDSTNCFCRMPFITTGNAPIVPVPVGRALVVGNFSNYSYSDDYGATWVADGIASGPTWNGCSMTSNGNALMAGRSGRCAYSDDYGETWTVIIVGSTGPDWEDCAILDNGRAILVRNDGEYAYSDDYGVNWTTGDMGGSDLFHCAMSPDGHALAVGFGGSLAYSDNYGVTWTPSLFGTDRINDCDILNNGRALLIAENGVYAYSDDYGVTWASSVLGTSEWEGCSIITDGHAILTRSNAYAYSDDYGETWISDITGGSGDLWVKCKLLSSGRAVTAGFSGSCGHSDDYGETWTSTTCSTVSMFGCDMV